jgi:hypothetical protein
VAADGIRCTQFAVPPCTLLRACRIPLCTHQVLPWVAPHHGARGGYSQLGSCIVKVRGVLQKGKLRLESERERKARSKMGGKKT